jgi:hypothetical protein
MRRIAPVLLAIMIAGSLIPFAVRQTTPGAFEPELGRRLPDLLRSTESQLTEMRARLRAQPENWYAARTVALLLLVRRDYVALLRWAHTGRLPGKQEWEREPELTAAVDRVLELSQGNYQNECARSLLEHYRAQPDPLGW